MGKVISLSTTPERLHSMLDSRYAGYAAWEAVRLKDYEIVCRECLIQLQSDLPVPVACRMMELIAIAYYYMGDDRASVHAMDQVLSTCATHPILHIMQAECLGRLGRRTVAIEMLANATCPDQPTDCLDSSAEFKMFAAGSLESLGAFHLALKLATEVCEQEPYNARYLIDLSYYTYRVHGLVQSVSALAWQAVRLEPQSMDYRIWLSRVLATMHCDKEAYEVIAEASEKQISSISCACCLMQIAKVYESVNDYARLTWCIDALQELEETSSEIPHPRRQRQSSDTSFHTRSPSTVDGVPYGGHES